MHIKMVGVLAPLRGAAQRGIRSGFVNDVLQLLLAGRKLR